MKTVLKYCGREFTLEEIRRIRQIIEFSPELNRHRLSFKICDLLDWHRIDGKPKDMSCRVALLRMEADGLIRLPAPTRKPANGRRPPRLTALSQPGFPIELPAGKLGRLDCVHVKTPRQSRLWNEHIERYHYLGYHPLPGAQIRYLVYSWSGLLAAIGFGAAAWQCKGRDQWIGWTHDQRKQNLSLIINNARYLILPWVRSMNLASRILALISHRIGEDWKSLYGYKPVLMETFVDTTRFSGTCYKAANWKYVGVTKGRGKLGDTKPTLPLKSIFVYPLIPDFRNYLTTDRS